MDFTEMLQMFRGYLVEGLSIFIPVFVSCYLVTIAFRIFKCLTRPFGRFDSFSGFLGSESKKFESKKEDVVIPEDVPEDVKDFISQHRLSSYKINLSKDKSDK